MDITESGIDRREFIEKEIARPCVGEVWIEMEVHWGHFNGPKKRYHVLTDGETIKCTEGQLIDKALIDYVKRQLDEIF